MKTPILLVAPLALTSVLMVADIAHAQTYAPSNRIPVADNSLGTQVSGNNNNVSIVGGLQKGQTLFHSFSDFSVPTSGQANFLNPAGNRDIITRVTGGLFSDINGTVNTQGANFFLINPNGLVFGPNARLNVGKAFVGSTANGIELVDSGGRTITFGTNPNSDAPLLSVNPNVFFNISRLNMGGGNGAIRNFGTLQTQNDSQYIGLIGGNVTLDGSLGGGKIIAPGGRVDIGGLNSVGTVSIDNKGLVFGGGGLHSDVSLINGANVTVRATGTLDTVQTFFNNVTAPGSSINISANNLDLLNSGTQSGTQSPALDAGLETNLQVPTKAAGDIKIDAIGKVNINNSVIKNTLRAGAEGGIGGIKIQAGALNINNSLISAGTGGKGNAGNIDLTVSGGMNLTNNSVISSENLLQTAQGNAGDINIKTTGDIKISGYESGSTNPTSSYLISQTVGQGNAGKITIDTQGKLSVVNSGEISSKIGATAVGNSKGVSIVARELDLANNSDISTIALQANRVNGKGNAGDINIKSTGDIKISGYDSSSTNPSTSFISSNTFGQGDTGKITIETQGKLSLVNYGNISSTISDVAVGNSKGISISARELELANQSSIDTSTLTSAQGNAGNINVKTTGDIKISGYNSSLKNPTTSDISFINSSNFGKGDAGKITIDTQGKLSLVNQGEIFSAIAQTGSGNSKGIDITAREVELANQSYISTSTFQTDRVNGKGNAGDINIKSTGDIKISGYDSSSTNPTNSNTSYIDSSTYGQGDTGKITIDTQGKLSLFNGGRISSTIDSVAVGNSKGINIAAQELELANSSYIEASTFQSERVENKGKGGDINIKTAGDIKISGSTNFNPLKASQIRSNSYGKGDAGKIEIDSQGKLSLVNQGVINSAIAPSAIGNSQGIKINAKELEIANGSTIGTVTLQADRVDGKGNAGDIEIITTGDIKISGATNFTVGQVSQINSGSSGQGNAGKISIDTQGKLLLENQGVVISGIRKDAIGNAKGISISAREIELNNASFIGSGTDQIASINGTGKAGNIDLKVKDKISLKNLSSIFTRSIGTGEAGNVSVSSSQLSFKNGGILSDAKSVSGGNITLAISDRLLLQNASFITTSSGSSERNGNGGNITISSPLIIATPGDNNIIANAYAGTGGNVNITSQGLFGIQYRTQGSDFTNDITASSTFGQSGVVTISTPGTDPGKDKGELKAAPNDASNQISQACSASQRDNKFYIIGRGGHPPNAEDPLTSEVVWRDPRTANSQPVASNANSQTTRKLVPPAVGWVFDGKGKVTLIAAQTEDSPTSTRVICPQWGK
ncbi:filamentous hemagglutinin N-terminal domain-containing protein [Chamaesiphon sp. VAR_48_metabat_135_sub]|uniref:two-partner secretion domain-containing protein n=1 Tax=Chamaesiphon sp. VAR_48_metabat_135_sub TaxID=2964699 RepID=UPI00286C1853|nr:filamentous hemagglutinin N-terminal domain-containing protein [Chamaesiphon sp. VAR_48_metabat_135_sub]